MYYDKLFLLLCVTSMFLPGWIEHDGYSCGPLICQKNGITSYGFHIFVLNSWVFIHSIKLAPQDSSEKSIVIFAINFMMTLMLMFGFYKVVVGGSIGPILIFVAWLIAVYKLLMHIDTTTNEEELPDDGNMARMLEDRETEGFTSGNGFTSGDGFTSGNGFTDTQLSRGLFA